MCFFIIGAENRLQLPPLDLILLAVGLYGAGGGNELLLAPILHGVGLEGAGVRVHAVQAVQKLFALLQVAQERGYGRQALLIGRYEVVDVRPKRTMVSPL